MDDDDQAKSRVQAERLGLSAKTRQLGGRYARGDCSPYSPAHDGVDPRHDPLLHERGDELEMIMMKPVRQENDATDPCWRWPNVLPAGSVYETPPLLTDSAGQVWTAMQEDNHDQQWLSRGRR